MVEPAPCRGGARLAIGQWQEIGLKQPHQIRRDDDERNGKREIGACRRQRSARVAIEQQEEYIRQHQHETKYFAQSAPPMAKPISSQCPKRPRLSAA